MKRRVFIILVLLGISILLISSVVALSHIEDRIKCIFLNSDTGQECSPSSHGIGCSGIKDCNAKIIYWGADLPEYNITSDMGEKIIWSSSCGNVSMIIGEHQWGEELVFDCREIQKSFIGGILKWFKKIIWWF